MQCIDGSAGSGGWAISYRPSIQHQIIDGSLGMASRVSAIVREGEGTHEQPCVDLNVELVELSILPTDEYEIIAWELGRD